LEEEGDVVVGLDWAIMLRGVGPEWSKPVGLVRFGEKEMRLGCTGIVGRMHKINRRE
jgi:hypothetical protein